MAPASFYEQGGHDRRLPRGERNPHPAGGAGVGPSVQGAHGGGTGRLPATWGAPRSGYDVVPNRTQRGGHGYSESPCADGEWKRPRRWVPKPQSLGNASVGEADEGDIYAQRVQTWLSSREVLRHLQSNGFVVLPDLLDEAMRLKVLQRLKPERLLEVADWKWYKALDGSGRQERRPRTIQMDRLNFGKGEYTYLREPLFEPLSAVRKALYSGLVELANENICQHRLEIRPKPFEVERYPESLQDFHDLCAAASPSQFRPTCLALHYTAGGQNLPHRDIYGGVSFPYQALVLLTKAGRDYTGGRFFMQPRKELARDRDRRRLALGAGDLLVFRSSLWHGSELTESGHRCALGIQFHLST